VIDGLVEFLLARYADTEELAREADRVWVHPGAHDPMFGARTDDDVASRYWERVADPDRVLTDVDAKRRIVADLRQVIDSSDAVHVQVAWLAARTLGHLAQPYAGHDEFREEWRL